MGVSGALFQLLWCSPMQNSPRCVFKSGMGLNTTRRYSIVKIGHHCWKLPFRYRPNVATFHYLYLIAQWIILTFANKQQAPPKPVYVSQTIRDWSYAVFVPTNSTPVHFITRLDHQEAVHHLYMALTAGFRTVAKCRRICFCPIINLLKITPLSIYLQEKIFDRECPFTVRVYYSWGLRARTKCACLLLL